MLSRRHGFMTGLLLRGLRLLLAPSPTRRRAMSLADFVSVLQCPDDAEILLELGKPSDASPDKVLTAGQRRESHRIARALFPGSGSPGERSEALRRAIVDSSVPATQRELALRLVETNAREIAPGHRRAILARCMELGAPAVDPYAPAASSETSRWAAVALLLADPVLDDLIIDGLRGGSLSRDSLLLIQAGALVQRDRAWGAFVAAVDAAALEPQEALQFAARCDRRGSTLDIIEVTNSRAASARAHIVRAWAAVRGSGIWNHPLLAV